MADGTRIEWTDATWNVITGCSVVSPGCTNCYAMKLAGSRLRNTPSRAGLTRDTKGGAVWTGDVRFNEQWLDQPLRWRRPRMIFVAAHGDLFHENVPDEWIDRVFAVMALAPQHTFQVLTKRPERMRDYCTDPMTPFRVAAAMDTLRGAPSGEEEVLPVPGYPGYFVSSHGRIFTEKRGARRVMKPDAGEQGHRRVQLHRKGTGKRGDRLLIHRIVLETFVGPAPTSGAQGRHLDRDPSNNNLGNLTWGDQPANWDDRRRHGTFRSYAKLTQDQVAEIRRRFAAGESAAKLGREYGVSDTQARNIGNGRQWAVEPSISWPLPNCWKGVSAEDHYRAAERIPILRETPAAVRWLSAEPLLGSLNVNLSGLDWVVAGGESGAGARPMHPAWVRTLRDQCQGAGIPFLFKQWGSWSVHEVDHCGGITPSMSMAGLAGVREWIGDRFAEPDAGAMAADVFYGGAVLAVPCGKKRAGRLLDGVVHDGFPQVEEVPFG